ncbi:hypothetical protein HPB51_020017 [Rhipicephalus microplus]|uniref:BED-type domain-containing protein n=1 Tax=Rhipicephalus microplus TaxID=6941 RepID=A0A9J6E3D9_RHIMP|nr:hypothetical protein HPB51_020017 [Rhipicephalus microplus]
MSETTPVPRDGANDEMEIADPSIFKMLVGNFRIMPLHSKVRTSYVWQHFGHPTYFTRGKQKKFGTNYYCEKCLTKSSNDDDSKPFESCKIKRDASTVSTSNMQRHLVDEHKLQDDSKGASRVTVKNYFQVVPRRNTTSSSRKNLLARDLVLLIARDLLPFNLVNGEGLQELQELPDRTTFTLSRSALDDVYRSMHGQVKKTVVQGPRFCAVTYDLWTDSYRRRAYITFSSHLVNQHHLCIEHALHNLVIKDGFGSIPELHSLLINCREIVKSVHFRASELQEIADSELNATVQSLVPPHSALCGTNTSTIDLYRVSHSVTSLVHVHGGGWQNNPAGG